MYLEVFLYRNDGTFYMSDNHKCVRSHKPLSKHRCFTAVYKFGRFGTDNHHDRNRNLHRGAKATDKEDVSEISGRIRV